MASDAAVSSHEQTTHLEIHETVRQLNRHLGPTLVALLANVRDRKLPSKWQQADGPTPRPDAQRRLMVAHRLWTQLSAAENEYVSRGWFIGANPRLSERSPVESLREGQLAEVVAAAEAFIAGSDD